VLMVVLWVVGPLEQNPIRTKAVRITVTASEGSGQSYG